MWSRLQSARRQGVAAANTLLGSSTEPKNKGSVNLGGTRTVLAHLTTGRFVSNYENENGSRHRRERRAYLAHAHAVLARRFKPASQAIKPASQRPPLCTETAELRNQFQNFVIRGPFSRLLFDNCEIVSVAISNCEIVSVAISEFSEILGDARIVLARENRGEFHVNPQISFRFFYDPQLCPTTALGEQSESDEGARVRSDQIKRRSWTDKTRSDGGKSNGNQMKIR